MYLTFVECRVLAEFEGIRVQGHLVLLRSVSLSSSLHMEYRAFYCVFPSLSISFCL